MRDLSSMKRVELLAIASELGVKGRSRMKKAELIRSIEAERAERELKKRARRKTIKFVRTGARRPGSKTGSSSISFSASARSSKTRDSKKTAALYSKVVPSSSNNKSKKESSNLPVGFEHIRAEVRPPLRYNNVDIRLLVRDPHWIFALWEVEDTVVRRAAHQAGFDPSKCSKVLRVHRLSRGTWFDLHTGEADNWYIEVPDEDSPYVVEFGIVLPNGRFIVLARSNEVRTPRESVSNRVDEKWATPAPPYEEVFMASGGLDLHKWDSLDFTLALRERLREILSSGSGGFGGS